ncbi:DUF3592 domain-containing protein [Dictyobacter aurantiacus]|uniref:DUF3592 domain-containing protein n=1 Tax=Dictyobacter aurantiacus TaxID=1936993 RepID=UPI000F82E07F|nr:DUF3592 domain-containing protein [Dictyobacter aurantiacus]
MIRYRTRKKGDSGCFVLLFGLIFLAVGIYLVRDTITFLPGTITAQGTIINCVYGDGDASNSCSPTVRFRTQRGQTITIDSTSSDSAWHKGLQVQVRYHPATPQDGRIGNSFIDIWASPLIFVGLGGLVVLIGMFQFVRTILLRIFMGGGLQRAGQSRGGWR